VAVSRFEVYLVNLEPTVGSEIRSTRPCLIVSPDEMNRRAQTVIVAPMTTGSHRYVTRVPCTFAGRSAHVVLDQMRSVDSSRLVRHLGVIDEETAGHVLSTLRAMFAP
jgi:mRNA interferase MazF